MVQKPYHAARTAGQKNFFSNLYQAKFAKY